MGKQMGKKWTGKQKRMRIVAAIWLVGVLFVGGLADTTAIWRDGTACSCLVNAEASELEKTDRFAIGGAVRIVSSEDNVTPGDDGVLEHSAGQDEGIMLIDELGEDEAAEGGDAAAEDADGTQTDGTAAEDADGMQTDGTTAEDADETQTDGTTAEDADGTQTEDSASESDVPAGSVSQRGWKVCLAVVIVAVVAVILLVFKKRKTGRR